MIQLTRRGILSSGTPEELKSLRDKYERDDYVILPQLYEPELLEELMRRIDAAPFITYKHSDIALEFRMDDDITQAMLSFFPNNPAFLRIIEQITGHPKLGEFTGRVYRMTSSDGHFDNWHDDIINHRAVTMSMNLSRQAFSGGALQLRRTNSKEVLHEIHNTGFGDALLFRIADGLVHRVQSVTGETPKTAFAGWFLEGEDLLPNLRNRLSATSRLLTNERPV